MSWRPVFVALVLAPLPALAGGLEPFQYMPVGDLVAGSGEGAPDPVVYAPGMRFPMEGAGFANSQVWGNGGSQGPGGGQCDPVNYNYPWRDNYCETRTWDMPLCPSGDGHQGQDIRPSTCETGVHWNVSPADATVTNIGSYSVYVTDAAGTRYDILHGASNLVSNGQNVARGERINNVSNEFGGTPTTIHMHFNIRQDVAGLGFVYVSPYLSLVAAYEDLFGLTAGVGTLDGTDCMAIEGWSWDPTDPDAATEVQLSFGGPLDGTTPVVQVTADIPRDDLCDALDSCDHGFAVEAPLSLRDGQPHAVHAYAVDGGRSQVELEESPIAFECPPPPVPDGVRRWLASPEIVSAWDISPLWDIATIDQPTIDAIGDDRDFPVEPVLVVSDDDPSTYWLMDPGYRRQVESAAVAEAWGLSLDDAAVWPASVLADVPVGTPVRAERFLFSGPDGRVYAMDDAQCALTEDGQLDPDCDLDEGADETADDGGDDADPPGTGSDSDGAGTGGSAGADDDSGGCGCRQGAPGGWWFAGLLGLFVIRRRSV